MNKFFCLMLLCLLSACDSFKEKTGLVKYQPDEYQVVTNPSLDIPPDFNIYSPEELEAKKSTQNLKEQGNLSKGESLILQNLNK